MTGHCPTCKRTRATPGDWKAFHAINCNNADCVWGGDRCWANGDCGIPASEVTELRAAATALRGGRQWRNVPHPDQPEEQP